MKRGEKILPTLISIFPSVRSEIGENGGPLESPAQRMGKGIEEYCRNPSLKTPHWGSPPLTKSGGERSARPLEGRG